jgi:hypothetical protein
MDKNYGILCFLEGSWRLLLQGNPKKIIKTEVDKFNDPLMALTHFAYRGWEVITVKGDNFFDGAGEHNKSCQYLLQNRRVVAE